jgi:uncharacterized protein YndB with AHSA1/START domain
MKLELDYEEVLPYPVEEVWSRLTDAAAISDWLMATPDFRPEVGARFRLKTEHLAPGGWIDAEVVELEPPRRMVWSWTPGRDAPATTVTFELVSTDGGTRLRLTHEGEIDPAIGGLLREGWPGRIELLRRSLD